MQHTRLTHVQHMKYYLCASYNCAAHKDGSRAAHERARVLYTKVKSHVTRKFRLSHSTKIQEHACVAARERQLRCELYHNFNNVMGG